MKVHLVTTWAQPCGIAEHSAMLKEAVEAADPSITIDPSPGWLDAEQCLLTIESAADDGDIVHLNYQASLHSRWDVGAIQALRSYGYKVIVTYHDTGVPNSDQCKAVCVAADAFVVHEPADDLPMDHGYYWRMGVSAPQTPLQVLPTRWRDQPILGTIGFPFPWKNYGELARVTRQVGWALLLIAPTASVDEIETWRGLNPDLHIYPEFLSRNHALSLLSACDATAFTYVCHNTGQSAAICQGIAARKPVIAFRTCRQFRALWDDPLGHRTIHWCDTFEQMGANLLHNIPLQRVDPGIVALAEQESWEQLGRKYATLYHEVSRT